MVFFCLSIGVFSVHQIAVATIRKKGCCCAEEEEQDD
jgi:hypothetical protein